ncbi:MAG: hypothetical protein BM555_00500 [Crocinitomix sp. MedPE-SWsnd]|nr:MAG: hypothetical protein BM555_00500 [Crocinitomix sp. MedPE-SWsnd]
MKAGLLIFKVLFAFLAFSQPNTDYLDKWTLELGKHDFQTTIPSEVHLDLYQSGTTTHPFNWNDSFSENMIEKGSFTYYTSFLGENYLEKDNIELVFEGLDTYADVYLNDSCILKANNMFRSWEVDIKNLIKTGQNSLRVEFTNPTIFNEEHVKSAKYQLPSGNETVDLKVSNYTRKAAYQFGWDWTERYVGCGIWRPVYIRSWDMARISDYYVETLCVSEEEAEIAYHIEIESDSKKKKKTFVKIDGRSYAVKLKEGTNSFRFEREIKNPKLWMPNGYGEPNMNLSKIELFEKKKLIDASAVHYGIRTVELVNEADSIGTSFYFKINGQAIFAKGANYVPMSTFPSEVDALDYKKMISEVREANMNMLRVWGGGIYEDELFYKFCDQNGILVWQDFMFANSMYPSDAAFHSNIKEEVKDNIRRLRKHPCLALWCGNNEIEVGWNNWGWQDAFGWSENDSTEIWNNYLNIFHTEIPAIVSQESSSIPYVSTSPLSNWGTKENFNHSSMHYWGVWHGEDDFTQFKNNVGRFMVEYGFQSYPKYDQLLKHSRGDVSFESDYLKNRQKSYVGDKWINREIEKRYDRVSDIKAWLQLSQHIQANALKAAIQSHRLNGKCKGTLFWQLNDSWPGPSWSVINYDQTEKVGFEEVRNLYSPQAIFVDTTEEKVSFWAVSDSPDTINVSLKINVIQGFNTLLEKSIPADLSFLKSKKIYSFDRKILETGKSLAPYIIIKLKSRITGETLFEDTFFFGLSPDEKSILFNSQKSRP